MSVLYIFVMLPVIFTTELSDVSKLNLFSFDDTTVTMAKESIHLYNQGQHHNNSRGQKHNNNNNKHIKENLPTSENIDTVKKNHSNTVNRYIKIVVCVSHILTCILFACSIPPSWTALVSGLILQTPSVWLVAATYHIFYACNMPTSVCGIVYVFLFPFWLSAMHSSSPDRKCVSMDTHVVPVLTVFSGMVLYLTVLDIRLYFLSLCGILITMISLVFIDTCGRVSTQCIQVFFCFPSLIAAFGLLGAFGSNTSTPPPTINYTCSV